MQQDRTWNGFFFVLVVALALGTAALAEGPEVPTRAGEPLGDFTAQYVACDEFAGVGLVPLANVIDLVPEELIVIEPMPGLALVVAQSGSCDEIRVEGDWAQPGIFAQFGVAIVPPLEPGNGDFYQILFATDHPQLASELRRRGVKARHDPNLSFEIDAEPALSIEVRKPSRLAFSLEGPIVLPDPLAPPNPTSIFNYYVQTRRHGNVLQRNVVEGIRFGEGSAVLLTAFGSEMQSIVGGSFLMFPFFSNPEVFDQADVEVIVDAF